jgi:hypothetical protein
MLHLVGADALAHGVGLGLGQAGGAAAQLSEQRRAVAVRRGVQGLGQRLGRPAADAGARQRLQQRQAPVVAQDAPVRTKPAKMSRKRWTASQPPGGGMQRVPACVTAPVSSWRKLRPV